MWDGAGALAWMLSCFARFSAEEAWKRLDEPAPVIDHGWPPADPALVVQETVKCVVQVAGRVRDAWRSRRGTRNAAAPPGRPQPLLRPALLAGGESNDSMTVSSASGSSNSLPGRIPARGGRYPR